MELKEKSAINAQDDLYFRNVIFNDNIEYYEKLKILHEQKVELQELKASRALSKPFVIEFSGTPRTGKTTIINNLYDFFKKGGFNIAIIKEFTTSSYYKEVFKEKYKSLDYTEYNVAIIEEVTKQLKNALNSNKEILLIDRSLNDRQVWNYRGYTRGNIAEGQYNQIREKYSSISRELIDFLVITYADPLISLKRDYASSLALEKRRFLNVENIDEYNRCLKDLQGLFEKSVEDLVLLDTSSMKMNDVSVEVATHVMRAMRKKYI